MKHLWIKIGIDMKLGLFLGESYEIEIGIHMKLGLERSELKLEYTS